MKEKVYLSELGGAQLQRKFWIMVSLIAVLSNLLLAATLMMKKNTVQTVFLPAQIHQPFVFNDGVFNNAYVEQVSTWFISQTLNYSPSSYEYQMNTFLRYADPALFGQLKQTLLDEFEDIKKQQRSSTFYIQKAVVKNLEAVVTGVHSIRVGRTEASTEQENWYVKLSQRGDGLVTLADFKQVSERDAKVFAGIIR